MTRSQTIGTFLEEVHHLDNGDLGRVRNSQWQSFIH